MWCTQWLTCQTCVGWDIQLAAKVHERFAFYGVIYGYFDLQKIPLKTCHPIKLLHSSQKLSDLFLKKNWAKLVQGFQIYRTSKLAVKKKAGLPGFRCSFFMKSLCSRPSRVRFPDGANFERLYFCRFLACRVLNNFLGTSKCFLLGKVKKIEIAAL